MDLVGKLTGGESPIHNTGYYPNSGKHKTGKAFINNRYIIELHLNNTGVFNNERLKQKTKTYAAILL